MKKSEIQELFTGKKQSWNIKSSLPAQTFKYTEHTAEQWDNIVRNNLSTGGRPKPKGILSLSQFKQALPTYP